MLDFLVASLRGQPDLEAAVINLVHILLFCRERNRQSQVAGSKNQGDNMATTQKHSGGTQSKQSGLLNKLKALLPTKSKKASKKPGPVMTKAAKMAADFDDAIEIRGKKSDKAHSPGHRKMNMKAQFNEPTGEKIHFQESALNDIAPADRIKQMETPQRRTQDKTLSDSQRGRRGAKKSR
jgi:hypothetical protein